MSTKLHDSRCPKCGKKDGQSHPVALAMFNVCYNNNIEQLKLFSSHLQTLFGIVTNQHTEDSLIDFLLDNMDTIILKGIIDKQKLVKFVAKRKNIDD